MIVCSKHAQPAPIFNRCGETPLRYVRHIVAADWRSYETQTKFASVVILPIRRHVSGNATSDTHNRQNGKDLCDI